MPRKLKTEEERKKERERLNKLKRLKEAEFREALEKREDFAVKKFKDKIVNLIKWYVKTKNILPTSDILVKAMRAQDPWHFKTFLDKNPDLKIFVNKELNKARKILLERCETKMLEMAFSEKPVKDAKARLMALEQVIRTYKSVLSEQEEDEAINLGADLMELIGLEEKNKKGEE